MKFSSRQQRYKLFSPTSDVRCDKKRLILMKFAEKTNIFCTIAQSNHCNDLIFTPETRDTVHLSILRSDSTIPTFLICRNTAHESWKQKTRNSHFSSQPSAKSYRCKLIVGINLPQCPTCRANARTHLVAFHRYRPRTHFVSKPNDKSSSDRRLLERMLFQIVQQSHSEKPLEVECPPV